MFLPYIVSLLIFLIESALIYHHELHRKSPMLVTIVDLIHRDSLVIHWIFWTVVECLFMIIHQHYVFSPLIAEIIAWMPHYLGFACIPYFAIGICIRYVLILRKSIQLDTPDESVVTFFRVSTTITAGVILIGFKLAGVKPRTYSNLAGVKVDDFATVAFFIGLLFVLVLTNVVLRSLIYWEQMRAKSEQKETADDKKKEEMKKNGNLFVVLMCIALGFFTMTYKNRNDPDFVEKFQKMFIILINNVLPLLYILVNPFRRCHALKICKNCLLFLLKICHKPRRASKIFPT